jgi:carboxyl-terminal processing protease
MPRRTRTALVVGLLAAIVTLSLGLAAGLNGQSAYRYLSVFREVWELTRANYVEPVEEDALLEGAYRGMVASLDAASAYLPPGEAEELLRTPGPGRTGLELLPSGGAAVVVRIDPGSPAEEAELRVGDQVWRIAGESSRQLSWPQLQRRLSGQPGETIELAVLDGRTFRLKNVSLELTSPAGPGYELTLRDGPVVHLRLHGLESVRRSELRSGLARLRAEHPQAPLLVDLRGVVGLDLQRAADVLGALVGEGPVFRLYTREGLAKSIRVPAGSRAELPDDVFVLVDGSTAGTGEALAAALRERAGGVLAGRETFGLGAVPEIIPLSRGGSVLLTTQQMRTVAGTTWADDGLEPDKVLELGYPRTAEERAADRLLDAALEWIRAGADLEAPALEERPAA